MSNQSLILSAIETRITSLSTGRTKLSYSYDLEKNNTRSERSAYGFGAGSADHVEGVMKTVTLDQEFFVVLTETFVNRSGDSKESESINAIYEDMESINADFVSSKLGIPSTILVVQSTGMDAPEKISENTISVKAHFIIKHRKATT